MLSKVINSLKEAYIQDGIILNGHFEFRSGMHSNQYISKDKICCDPILFKSTVEILANLIVEEGLDVICDVITGPAVAGAIFAAPISLMFNKTFIYPEKTSSTLASSMEFRRGFDKVLEGKKVILIEDIITTGGSVVNTIEAVVSAGGEVMGVVCIWNRSTEQMQLLSGPNFSGIPVHSLINQPVEIWNPDHCPLCKEDVPLTNPKG